MFADKLAIWLIVYELDENYVIHDSPLRYVPNFILMKAHHELYLKHLKKCHSDRRIEKEQLLKIISDFSSSIYKLYFLINPQACSWSRIDEQTEMIYLQNE